MIYFSILNNDNIVTSVLVSPEKFNGQEEKFSSETGQKYKQTYKNSPPHNFAGVGFTYDINHDVFYEPQPYASWILNSTTYLWEAPVAYPSDGKYYIWNEDSKNWVEP